MIKQFSYLFSVAIVLALNTKSIAQETKETTTTSSSSTSMTIGNGSISDEQTVDPEQNKKWKSGQYKYSAKPRSMWELGIHAGHFMVNGDVPSPLPSGFGLGFHVRKAINYTLSIRADFFYGQSKGLDPRATPIDVVRLDNPAGFNAYPNGGIFYRNFKTQTFYGALEGILSIGNILFHQERNKWNAYLGFGVALASVNTKTDALDANGNPYDFSSIESQYGTETAKERKDKRKAIKNAVDGKYETSMGNDRQTGFLFDDGTLVPQFHALVGISRKINKRMNISLEHKIMLNDFDRWDGFIYRSTADQTNDGDNGHYTSLRLAFNLGSFDKRTEPLYWLNPLDAAMNDIAELKQRPILDLTDTDGDGVIDMMDKEANTPAGAPVDVRGVALDSDKDGVADYKDTEPFSPPGYPVNDKGVAIIPDPYVTESDVNKIINNKLSNVKSNWFLPMINFDLDKYFIKPEMYPQLYQVATVMKMHPDLKLVVTGNTDVRLSNEYNKVLSYNRAQATIDFLVAKHGIARDRFVIQYSGKEEPLVPNLPASHTISKKTEMEQYLNRRVEFRVATVSDQEMPKPNGKAGKNTPGSSRPGSKYSGNANSGY